MANPINRTRPNLPLALVAVVSLLVCGPSSGRARALQAEGGCAQTRPVPARSYDSFFGRQGPVGAESREWRIDLAKRETSSQCTYAYQFLFRVKNKLSGAVSQFTLCNVWTVQVDEIDLVNETRALIMVRASADSPVATIVELPSGKVVDHFYCFLAALSPDHHFLAFVKSFPGHPGPVAISHEYIVYDLTRSGEYNRPQSKPGVKYDAGWVVYPPEATNAVGENILPEGSPYHVWSSRGLFWLDDVTLTFADFFQGENLLVAANLSRGAGNPEVRTLNLDPSQLVDLDQCKKYTAPSDFKIWSEEPAGLIHVTQISPVPGRPGVACLYFIFKPVPTVPESDGKAPLTGGSTPCLLGAGGPQSLGSACTRSVACV